MVAPASNRQGVGCAGAEADHSDDAIDVQAASDPLPEQACHDAGRHCLDAQISSFDVLDTRAVQVFSVGSAALPLTVALLNLGSNEIDIPRIALLALGAGLLVYGWLLVCVVWVAFVRKLEYKPDMTTLRDHSLTLPGVALVRWIADEYVVSTQRNRMALDRKSRWVGLANTALYAEGVLLAVAAFLILL